MIDRESLLRDLSALGVQADDRVMVHASLRKLGLACKRRTRWDYVITRDGVPTHVWIDCLDDSEGIADWDEDYFAVITNAYVAQGRARGGCVGQAQSELLDAADFVRFGAAWMEENFR